MNQNAKEAKPPDMNVATPSLACTTFITLECQKIPEETDLKSCIMKSIEFPHKHLRKVLNPNMRRHLSFPL